MQLHLQNIAPNHLQDRHAKYASEIWGKELTISAGNCVFVQAPSGVGKTTLMHILYAIRKDYAGNVKWGTLQLPNINENKLAQLRSQELSIVFQDMRLFPNLTAMENVIVKSQLTNTTSSAQISEWMALLGIQHKKDAIAATLSYGEQQRVAIIRALVQPFQWLLMDEPFSHLDMGNRDKAISLIQDVVSSRNAGMILADLNENSYFPYQQTLRL